MVENLVYLFTQLSLEIVRQAVEIENDEFESKKKNGSFNKYVRELRQKCFDIVIQSNQALDYSDPCKTLYGANWNPLILILDYGGELANYGSEKVSKNLAANIQTLQGKNYTCLHDMYKLIFLLRGSCTNQKEELQPAFMSTVSEYSLKSNYPISDIYADVYGLTEDNIIPSQGIYKKYSTKIFESGCQLLTKLSNRNITSDIGKHRHLSASTSKITDPSKSSYSNDFVLKQKSYSNSSFVQVASNLCSSNHSLWDNFVEKPITSKLRRVVPEFKSCSLPENSGGSGEHFKNGFKVHEMGNIAESRKPDNYWTEVCDIEKMLKLDYENKENANEPGIVLFPIVKENALKLENYASCFDRKVKSGDKHFRRNIRNSFFQSTETLILALWEQELKFRCTYNPTLNSCVPKMRILELEQFLKHVQFLLVGIGTDTFKIDEEELCFTMQDGTCLEGVTPSTLLIFSMEYLAIGASYIKLSHHASLNLKNQMISGSKNCRIIFKVFWMSIYEYLCRHSQYVLKIPVNLGLLEFKSCVKNLYPIITAVAEVCKVNEKDDVLPQGGQLLSYILQATQKINNTFAAGVLFGILKACCETYLVQFLQDWMFQGHLYRYQGDFFVEHRPKNHRCKDRSYYLSFFMIKDRIPSFLRGLENNVFNCGKTIHLLKLIQPDSKFCRLLETRTYPRMKLCLTERELKEQRRIFERYAENVTNICGQFVSIASLKLQEITREHNYEKYIMQVKKEQELERAQLKKESMEELRRKREEQNQWLSKQIQLAAEEKRKKREQEEKESQLFVDRVRRIAEEERRLVEEEKQNIKMFYEELMDEIDQKKSDALTWKQRSVQLNKKNALLRDCKSDDEICLGRDSPTVTETPDFSLLNGDKIVDREGNIISCEVLFTKPELDIVNSNVKSVENRLDDIENENVDSNDVDAQLQRLIDSRNEYYGRLKTETIAPIKGNESHCRKTESEKTNSPPEDTKKSPRSVKSMTQKKKPEIMESPDKKKDHLKKTAMLTEAQKNRIKIMGCEFGMETNMVKEGEMKKTVVKASPPETEAARNKRKIMASEYGSRSGKTKNRESGQKPKTETEAEKNKKKVMLSEYDMKVRVEEKEKSLKQPVGLETEAQKNKKKVMASEFDLPLEPETDKGDVEKEKKPTVETEAQRNKRKVLGTEFGECKLVELKERCKSFGSLEAQKNKKQVLEIEYGYHENAPCENGEDEPERKELIPLDIEEEDLLTEEEILDRYINSELLMKPSSMTEKALEIYNKRNPTKDDLRFFTLKDETSAEYFSSSFPWSNFSEVQVLFEQHLQRTMINTDPTAIAAGFVGMDTTTFMNCMRQSALIPLQVQEAIANEALLNHLLKKENMLLHFNALRNYYFLNDGEFSRRLTQNIFVTLAKCTEPQQFFKRSTMNQIVYEALNYTIHSSEPYTQNVSFEIMHMPSFLSHASHDVLSPFDLSYQVKWPLNIIITEKALSKYKLVFHFLLKLKRINWTLNENFSVLTYSCKEKHIKSRLLINSPHYHKVHIYRHAMGQFMRTLENYTSSCSLQFSWLNFEKDLESAKNLDHLYEKHVRYIKEVLKRCFLTKESHELLTCINSLIELSLKFHYATKSGTWVLTNGKSYQHSKFEVLKTTFIEFCNLTTEFLRTLRKKINNYHDLKPHEVLMEKFEMILR